MRRPSANGESKIRKILFNEITFVVALVSLISGTIFWVSNPQNEMEIRIVRLESQVESNQTVQVALEKIKNNDFVEFQLKLNQIEERQIKTLESLAAINQQLLILKE
ncbi:MAG: hypothetical protein KAS32_24910 [Candidatus Peribacteraceae bacterium]|nr:hypothetical protein [Candidatus Peribacteraceae bacterium]